MPFLLIARKQHQQKPASQLSPMSFWNLQGTQSDLGPPPLNTVSLEFWNLCKHVVEAKLSIPTVTVQGGESEAQLNTHYALNILPGP